MALSVRFHGALAYASLLHAAQQRKASEVPYVAHLLAVTSLVLEHGGDEDQAIAALLHDAIEDQGGDAARQAILQRFGPNVIVLIDACTDTDQQPKPPWRERKEQFLQRLTHAPTAAKLIVAADKLHNLRTLVADHQRLGDDLWSAFNGGREGTRWYYRAAFERLESDIPSALREQLAQALADLEALPA